MRRIALRLLLIALPAMLACAAPAAAADKTYSASSGAVRATLTYQTTVDQFTDTNAALTITRAGVDALSGPIPPCGEGCALSFIPDTNPLTVRDLDGNGEPEVLVDLFSGGAHCCYSTLLYSYVPATGTYQRAVQFWGDPGYQLEDVDRDGLPELVSADDRFAYAFVAYAASALPIEIFQVRGGRFLRVTTHFPHAIAHDAAALYRLYRQNRREPTLVRGLLPAYAADEAMLGRFAHANAVIHRAGRLGQLGHGGSAYLAAVRRFLRRLGYIR
jgi:hypothetical protein